MASIIEFRAPTAPRLNKARSVKNASRSAEIIIFPGIRYERWGDAEKSAASMSDAPNKQSTAPAVAHVSRKQPKAG